MKLRCGFSRMAEGDVTSLSPLVPPFPCRCSEARPHASTRNGGACYVWSCHESRKEARVARALQGGAVIQDLALLFRPGSACP